MKLRRPGPDTSPEASPGPAPEASPETLRPPSNRLVLANAAVKGFAAVLALGLQIVLVKLLGEADYGAYVLFINFCFVLSILGKGGLDISTLRYFAVARSTCEPPRLRSVRSRALLLVTLYSLVAVGLGQLFRLVPGLHFGLGGWATLVWMIPTVLTFSLLVVVSGMLRGAHRVLLAESLDSVARPLALLLVAALSTYVLALDGVNAGLTAFVASNILVGIAILVPFNRSISKSGARGPACTPPSPFRPKAALVLSAAGLLSYGLFQLDTLLVGVFLGPESVASYAMACNYARIVVFTALIINAQSQPLLAAAFGSGQTATLRRITLVAIRNSVAAAVAGMLILVIFGRPLLRAVSADFGAAYPALVVISAAYLVNSVILILSGMLVMCRKEAVAMWAHLIGLAVCVPLLLLLVPRLGRVGAATAVLVSLVVVSIVVIVRVRGLFRRVLL